MSYCDTHPGYREVTAGAVRLVEPTKAHAQASLRWLGDPAVTRNMGADFSCVSLDTEERRIRDALANEDSYTWMIELDGEAVGNVTINDIAAKTSAYGERAGNLVFLVGDPAHRGKGVAMLACRAVLEWAATDGKFAVMTARALPGNAASIALLGKLGFVQTGSEPFEGTPHAQAGEWLTFEKRLGS